MKNQIEVFETLQYFLGTPTKSKLFCKPIVNQIDQRNADDDDLRTFNKTSYGINYLLITLRILNGYVVFLHFNLSLFPLPIH